MKVKIYEAILMPLLITSSKYHNLPSCVYCQRWASFAYEVFHSYKHCFYKANIFHISWSFNVSFFYCTLIAANVILKATARWRENSFFFVRILFLTLTSFNSKGYYRIALKFSAKQINMASKKSWSAICEIMDINVDFRIFVNSSHSVFIKKH